MEEPRSQNKKMAEAFSSFFQDHISKKELKVEKEGKT
jgi:hypothetical protein